MIAVLSLWSGAGGQNSTWFFRINGNGLYQFVNFQSKYTACASTCFLILEHIFVEIKAWGLILEAVILDGKPWVSILLSVFVKARVNTTSVIPQTF